MKAQKKDKKTRFSKTKLGLKLKTDSSRDDILVGSDLDEYKWPFIIVFIVWSQVHLLK